MSEFYWSPSYGSSSDGEIKISEAMFGDGYSQRVGDGINNLVEKWELIFQNLFTSDFDLIIAFIKARKSGESFTWTPIDSPTEVRVICSKFSSTSTSFNNHDLSLSFKRVYE